MRIGIRTDGNNETGFGHIYRTMILAALLSDRGHNVTVITSSADEYAGGTEKLKTAGYRPITISDERSLETRCPDLDVLVVDILNTGRDDMMQYRKCARRVVSIEDLGEGAFLADAVINGIYEHRDGYPREKDNWFWGPRYICLRDDIIHVAKNRTGGQHQSCRFGNDGREDDEDSGNIHVLATFGGTDPLDISYKSYRALAKFLESVPGSRATIVLGPGYRGVLDTGKKWCRDVSLDIVSDVENLCEMMEKTDIALCSKGTTAYELASMGIPSITIAQNEREEEHLFCCRENGFVDLGLGTAVQPETIYDVLIHLSGNRATREQMAAIMRQMDLSGGTERVCDIICALQ